MGERTGMKILVVGAGATGGYFGGRLLQAGRDVTFLVRPGRAAELATTGLNIKSPFGDVSLARPATVVADKLDATYDLVLLSCKAYDLGSAVDAFAPAVGAGTLVLPVLNGMRHLDVLDRRFGRAKVLGGLCSIAATLDEHRNIIHLNDLHSLTFGGRDDSHQARIPALSEVLTDSGFNARPSDTILHDMWEKWVFLATLASATCLMRSSVGQILRAPGGADVMAGLLAECSAIASGAGFAPRPMFLERGGAMLADEQSTLTASMLRDIESRSRIEADHIVGDLLYRRQGKDIDPPLSVLRIAYAHLKVYEAGSARKEKQPESR
jgi:2-dehydropantoate 2-reductase